MNVKSEIVGGFNCARVLKLIMVLEALGTAMKKGKPPQIVLHSTADRALSGRI